jgi:hypothetical protein
MDSIAHRAAVVVACASLGLLALGFGSASAFTNSYCGQLIPQNQWCGDGSLHSYDYNSAAYSGAGSVWVCERLVLSDGVTERERPTCGYTSASSTFGPYGFLTQAQVMHNTGGGASHTIYGYATA